MYEIMRNDRMMLRGLEGPSEKQRMLKHLKESLITAESTL